MVVHGPMVDPLVADLAGMVPDPGVIEESHWVINNWVDQQRCTAEAILAARSQNEASERLLARERANLESERQLLERDKVELVALNVYLTEHEERPRSGRAAIEEAAAREEAAADAARATQRSFQGVLVGALAALRQKSQAVIPEVEDLQRQLVALQEASQRDRDQFALDRRAWANSKERAQAMSDARIKELEDTVSSLTQRSSELQRSLLEGARQREAAAQEAREREMTLQEHL